jgi:hypothetical protein
MKANGKPKIKCSKHVSYTYIFEELTQNTHPSIQKAVPACYHAKLLIKYIFSFDDSKTKYVKEENRKRKEIQQPGYTAFEWPNIYIYISSFHSSDSLVTLISKSLSTNCLHIGHLSVWNLKTLAHPLHIHCNMERKPINTTRITGY